MRARGAWRDRNIAVNISAESLKCFGVSGGNSRRWVFDGQCTKSVLPKPIARFIGLAHIERGHVIPIRESPIGQGCEE